MEIEAKFKLEDPSALQFWMHCIEHEQNFGGWVRHDRDDGIRRMRSFTLTRPKRTWQSSEQGFACGRKMRPGF